MRTESVLRYILLFLLLPYFFSIAPRTSLALVIFNNQTVDVTAVVPDPNVATTTLPTDPGPGGGSGGPFNGGNSNFSFYSSGSNYNSLNASSSTSSPLSLTTLTADQLSKIIIQQVSNLVAYANQQVSIRVSGLEKLYNDIQSSRSFSNAKKSSLLADIAGVRKGINLITGKVNADTTIDDVSRDTNLIFSNYRVTTLVIPRVKIIMSAQDTYATAKKIIIMNDQLVDAASKKDKKDSAILLKKLQDVSLQVRDAIMQARVAETTVTPLVSDQGNPIIQQSNKTLLTAATAHIAIANQDLLTALKIIEEVKNNI